MQAPALKTLADTGTSGWTPLSPQVLEAARTAAASVDSEGRFPVEAFEALRAHGALGVLADPAETSLARVAADCYALAGACSSAGMILAMHHIQVACLARHAAGAPWHDAFLRRIIDQQLLLASSTSEVGIGGNLRSSLCAVVSGGGRFSVVKQASAISYAADADVILVTARAHPEASAGDQSLVVLEGDDFQLEAGEAWDAMGMRGTGSGAFVLTGAGETAQVVPVPFGEIAGTTMAPVSHILWGAVWTGIAADAVARARACVRSRRKAGSTELPAGALRLAEAVEKLQMAEARVRTAIAAFDWKTVRSPDFAEVAADNNLKTSVGETCLEVAQIALSICGFAGYARQGPYSVARHVRDLHSAPIMIANERMREGAAQLLLAQKPRLGLFHDRAAD
ncbi:acyl-CoA dehydrogenase [Caulobacter sp. HMWF009]|nr:acyl-CoA dehydrogenase [Caulobacter sp. HMWF009]PTT05442.1 acyl-CoA dehydrogenase [Caulobacter sp. HMWF025]